MPETLLYLYGITPPDAPEPPAALRGVADRPVRGLEAAGLRALVSEVPAAEFGDEALDARLTDLRWVGERAVEHERVLDWFAERTTVVPLRPFSLHAGTGRVADRLAERGPSVRRLLEALRGRREWGIKLWRTPSAGEHLPELSPRLRTLRLQSESAPPGRRFLLERKAAAAEAEELRAATRAAAREVIQSLSRSADGAEPLPLPAGVEAERTLALHAAFLVRDEAFEAFQRAVSEAAHRWGALGFELEFTGPWPPYHFAEIPDERADS